MSLHGPTVARAQGGTKQEATPAVQMLSTHITLLLPKVGRHELPQHTVCTPPHFVQRVESSVTHHPTPFAYTHLPPFTYTCPPTPTPIRGAGGGCCLQPQYKNATEMRCGPPFINNRGGRVTEPPKNPTLGFAVKLNRNAQAVLQFFQTQLEARKEDIYVARWYSPSTPKHIS